MLSVCVFIFALRLDLIQWEERRSRLAREREYLLSIEGERDALIENEGDVKVTASDGLNSKSRSSYGAVERRQLTGI